MCWASRQFSMRVFGRPRAADRRSDKSRRFPSGMAVVQAFEYVISANLQNCTVNYTKDSLRATPSVMFLMLALTTLLLICNSRSLNEAKKMWSMPSACSEHTVPCRARRLPAALRNRAPFKHGTGRWLEAVEPL